MSVMLHINNNRITVDEKQLLMNVKFVVSQVFKIKWKVCTVCTCNGVLLHASSYYTGLVCCATYHTILYGKGV